IADDGMPCLTDGIRTHGKAQLPFQVSRQRGGLGEKILERRSLDNLGFWRSKSGVKVVVEKRPEIDLLERILMVAVSGDVLRRGRSAFRLLVDFIDGRNVLRDLFQNRVGNHLPVNHLPQLELIERKNADHLHKARRQDLLLRHLEVQPDSWRGSTAHRIQQPWYSS